MGARSRIVEFSKRWMAETVTSRFKTLFGEHLLSRKLRWIDIELMSKAYIYNILLNKITS